MAVIQRESSKQMLPLRIAKCNAGSLSAAWEVQGSEANSCLCIVLAEVTDDCWGSGGSCKFCHLKRKLQGFLDPLVQKILLDNLKRDLFSILQRWPVSLKHGWGPGSSLQQKIRPCVLQKQLVEKDWSVHAEKGNGHSAPGGEKRVFKWW